MTTPVNLIPPEATPESMDQIQRELSKLAKSSACKPKTWNKTIKGLILAGLKACHQYTKRLLELFGITHKQYSEWIRDPGVTKFRDRWLTGEQISV